MMPLNYKTCSEDTNISAYRYRKRLAVRIMVEPCKVHPGPRARGRSLPSSASDVNVVVQHFDRFLKMLTKFWKV